MIFQFPNGMQVRLDQAFSYEGTNYPSTWLRGMTPEARAAWGLVELPEPEAPVTPAPPTVPQTVSRAQAKIALHRKNKLVAIQAYIDASEDVELKLWWNEAAEFHRNNQYVNALAPNFGMTSEDLDDVFTEAASIV
jgi:hypothetical protein